eukprot:TRINITY_DN611_c7_g1_i1.p1 TRINITY_DN611_c7_g1~~TRINITY_DN611_c7_g1_i1.p1  ORF type:complete len:449 (+),score=126.16 TRINITY_DN611_c7_g1_i1:64-1410(+)
MSVIPKETIKIIAESCGIVNLNDDIAMAVVSDVEYRLREVAQEACKFMMHSKRQKLTTEDINNALRLRNLESLHGYSNKTPLHFRRAVGTTDLYYIEDEKFDFIDIINAPLPKCPRDVSINAHWLSIGGFQPRTKWNPNITKETNSIQIEKPEVKEVDDHVIKPIVKHSLSVELQLYYEKITKAINSDNNELKEAALVSLREDPGMNQLLPYFSQWISDQIVSNMKNLDQLNILISMIEALSKSEHLQIEPYLHQLMPSIITCIVANKLCDDPNEDHWSLREKSASLCSYLCSKFGVVYKTLQPRVTKTFITAFLNPKKPLTTHFGAITGLAKLGHNVIQVLVIPNIKPYYKLLELKLSQNEDHILRTEAQHCYNALLNCSEIYLQNTIKESLKQYNDENNNNNNNNNNNKKTTLEILFPDGMQYYNELYEIFGDSLVPFLSTDMDLS